MAIYGSPSVHIHPRSRNKLIGNQYPPGQARLKYIQNKRVAAYPAETITDTFTNIAAL